MGKAHRSLGHHLHRHAPTSSSKLSHQYATGKGLSILLVKFLAQDANANFLDSALSYQIPFLPGNDGEEFVHDNASMFAKPLPSLLPSLSA
jgi:hypothetical protein